MRTGTKPLEILQLVRLDTKDLYNYLVDDCSILEHIQDKGVDLEKYLKECIPSKKDATTMLSNLILIKWQASHYLYTNKSYEHVD